tara:strand:- start:715 stop:1533 length:819 start_codon:yes stop_codon:yes gene_type:complete
MPLRDNLNLSLPQFGDLSSDVGEALRDVAVSGLGVLEDLGLYSGAGLRQHEPRGDASTAYANNNDYYIYFTDISSGISIKFKAFLTGFDDSYSSDWRDVETFGRMDPISTFQGTRRQINFGFDVVAGDAGEAIDNYKKSRILLSRLYPKYQTVGSATAMSAPPMLKIRFTNLISEKSMPVVGKLGGLSHRPNMDLGFFEGRGELYPKVNSFSCNFNVFHTGKLGFRTRALTASTGGTTKVDEGAGVDAGKPSTGLDQQKIQSVGQAAANILK